MAVKARIVFALVLSCAVLGGCASLMMEEKKRALYESYEKGRITKVEYLSRKSLMEREEREIR